MRGYASLPLVEAGENHSECSSECPENNLRVAIDYAAPDTRKSRAREIKHTGQGVKGNIKNSLKKQIIGYVPLQVVNLSLEEVELSKHMYVGTASPTRISSQDDSGNQSVYGIQKFNDDGKEQKEFEEYLTERLKHLSTGSQIKASFEGSSLIFQRRKFGYRMY
jgi:hypothetical protein